MYLANGQQAVCESLYTKIVNTLKMPAPNYNVEKECQLLGLATQILRKSSYDVKKFHSATILDWVQKISANDNITAENLKKAKAFFSQCTDCECNCLYLCLKTGMLSSLTRLLTCIEWTH